MMMSNTTSEYGAIAFCRLGENVAEDRDKRDIHGLGLCKQEDAGRRCQVGNVDLGSKCREALNRTRMERGHTAREGGAENEHQDSVSKVSKAMKATADKKLKNAKNKATTTQDQHTTLRMNNQEGDSVHLADINQM